jgi:hypothetical protein
MNCFGPKRFPLLLACYVDGKAGYATFKVMLLLKRNHNQQQSLLTTFKKNKWLSNLISFWNMPIIYEYYKQQV